MTLAADLFALQETDSALDSRAQDLERVLEQLAGDDRLSEAQAAAESARAARAAAAHAAHEVETELADHRAHLAPKETRLYDGSITNARELEDLQHEVEGLQRQQRAIEDRQLEAIDRLERATAAQAEAEQQAATLAAAIAAEQAKLHQQEEQITADRTRLEAQRAVRAGRIDPPRLALYERLRRTRHGRAVARVERGACLGCRISLPSAIVQRARSGSSVVQCTSCERILYVS